MLRAQPADRAKPPSRSFLTVESFLTVTISSSTILLVRQPIQRARSDLMRPSSPCHPGGVPPTDPHVARSLGHTHACNASYMQHSHMQSIGARDALATSTDHSRGKHANQRERLARVELLVGTGVPSTGYIRSVPSAPYHCMSGGGGSAEENGLWPSRMRYLRANAVGHPVDRMVASSRRVNSGRCSRRLGEGSLSRPQKA